MKKAQVCHSALKKARFAGEWTMSSYTNSNTYTNSSGTTVTTFNSTDGSAVTKTTTSTPSGGSATTTTKTGTITMTATIEKDGSYTNKKETSFTTVEEIFGVNVTTVTVETTEESGSWNWADGVGEAKKKEMVIFRPTSGSTTTVTTTTPQGGSSTTTTSSNSSTITGEETAMTIKLLKNKELHMVMETSANNTNSSTSGGSTSTSTSNSITSMDITYKQ